MRLETPRLILRPLRHADAGAIVQHIGNLEVARWLTVVPHPYTAQDARTFLQDRVPFGAGGHLYFAMTLQGVDELIGIIGLDALDAEPGGRRDFGYWLAEEHWRKGYVGEAARAVVAWVFEGTQITQLHAGCQEDNQGSRTILEALVFHRTGSKPVFAVALGKERTSVKFALTRDVWETHHET